MMRTLLSRNGCLELGCPLEVRGVCLPLTRIQGSLLFLSSSDLMNAFIRVRRSGGGGLVRADAQSTPSSLPKMALQVQPSQSGWGLGTSCLPIRGACPALLLLWDKERSQSGGLQPFPGPGRKGLCGTLILSSGVGTFLGRGLASSPELGRGLRPGAGVGALNGPLCLHTRSLCGGAHSPTLLPQAPPTQHPGAQPHHWLWFRADTSKT